MTADKEIVLGVRNLTKAYSAAGERVAVLRGVNLEIAAGERVALRPAPFIPRLCASCLLPGSK